MSLTIGIGQHKTRTVRALPFVAAVQGLVIPFSRVTPNKNIEQREYSFDYRQKPLVLEKNAREIPL
jgi:hypothetical protein